jgi:uncharacterized phage protein gp47/JayE
MAISLASLFTVDTAARLLDRGLQVGAALGLPVTSWRSGDPTLSTYHFLATILGELEGAMGEFVRAGFLSTATGDWLTLYASEVYGVEREEGSYASGAVTLENTGGGYYPFEIGELTFKSTVTGKTYTNTSAGILDSGPGTTVTLDFTADEIGTASSLAIDELDEIVSGPLDVEVQTSTAAAAVDAWSDEDLRAQCTASLGALSPNGPADAYAYVAKNSELTGVTGITKARAVGDGDTGDVVVYLAGPDGDVSGALVTAAEDAIATWALPLCITPTVQSAAGVSVPVTLTVYVRTEVSATDATIEAAVEAKLEAMIAELDIGGNEGFLHRALITSKVAEAYPGFIYNVTIAAPAADVALGDDEVAELGAVTITVVQT